MCIRDRRKIEKIPEDAPVIMWKDFMKLSRSCYYKTYKVKREGADPLSLIHISMISSWEMTIS